MEKTKRRGRPRKVVQKVVLNAIDARIESVLAKAKEELTVIEKEVRSDVLSVYGAISKISGEDYNNLLKGFKNDLEFYIGCGTAVKTKGKRGRPRKVAK